MSKIILCGVELNCTTEKAFEMFTNARMLERWLCDRAEVEAVLGGKYELFWKPPPENSGTVGCKITAMEKGKFLAFDWKGPTMYDDFMNLTDRLTQVVVLFIPVGNGKRTKVDLIHSGWGTSKEWNEAREWFENAWTAALKVLSSRIDNE